MSALPDKKTESDDTSEQHRRILGNAKQEHRGASRRERPEERDHCKIERRATLQHQERAEREDRSEPAPSGTQPRGAQLHAKTSLYGQSNSSATRGRSGTLLTALVTILGRQPSDGHRTSLAALVAQ